MNITGIDHVQLAMPAGREAEARAFYGGLLGLPELTKPEQLQARGGCWFTIPGSQLHMGVEAEFLPQRKAHPALLVRDLEACRAELAATGVPIVPDATLPNVRRFYASDPFGNRLEFIQQGDGFASLPERVNLPGS